MTHTTTPTAPQAERSPRLRADVALYPGPQGLMLRVGDTHHHVHLAPSEADALLDVLTDESRPLRQPVTSALDALVEEGLVDPVPPSYDVVGDGLLAAALRAALERMGAHLGPEGSRVTALDAVDERDELPPFAEPGALTCCVSNDLVLLAPPGVSARDVAARRRAATIHRDSDPLTQPLATGRSLISATPIPPAGLELAAVAIAAELLRGDRPTHEVLTVDLHQLRLAWRPVLPVPMAPR